MAKTEFGQWIQDAKSAGWSDLGFLIANAQEVHGDKTHGFWRCQHCNAPVVDPCIAGDCSGEAVMLTAQDGIGVTILCDECHAVAVEARAKIVVHVVRDEDDNEIGTEEDDSALTEDEGHIANYIDWSDEGNARQSRDLIRDYPRDERRKLHGYQDRIDAEKAVRGKKISD